MYDTYLAWLRVPLIKHLEFVCLLIAAAAVAVGDGGARGSRAGMFVSARIHSHCDGAAWLNQRRGAGREEYGVLRSAAVMPALALICL